MNRRSVVVPTKTPAEGSDNLLRGADVKLAELLSRDGRRSAAHGVRTALGLGEGDHFADRALSGHEGHYAVEPQSHASVRGHAVIHRFDQEAELGLNLLFVQAQYAEDRLRQIRSRNPDRAASQFDSVQHQIVGVGAQGKRVFLEFLQPLQPRSGEGMVYRLGPSFPFVLLEHGGIDYPEELPALSLDAKARSQGEAKRTKTRLDHTQTVGHEEKQVARLRL